MDTLNKTRAAIAKYRDDLFDMETRYRHVLLGAGYVIRNQGVHYRMKVENRTVTDVTTCSLEQCNLFTREDAEKVAVEITNGRGEKAHAVHIKDAIKDEIQRVREALRNVDQAIDNGPLSQR